MADFSAMLPWQDDPTSSFGPGISRADDHARTFTYRLKVRMAAGGAPLLLTFQAENATKAKKYAQSRWPGCLVVSCERRK